MQNISKKEELGNSEGTRQDIVEIKINDELYPIHRGRRSVAEIKISGGVPLADKLEQVVGGELVSLADDGFVVIKGREEFKSHVQSGGAS